MMSNQPYRASAQQLPITDHTKLKEQATGITDHQSPFDVL
jgi:hypothetical protein